MNISKPGSNLIQCTINGQINRILLSFETRGTIMLPVKDTRHQLQNPLPHSPNPTSRYLLQHIQNPHPSEHHLLLRYKHRQLLKLRLRQMPPILSLRRKLLEENRYAPREYRVERGPARGRVPGRLQAETSRKHWPHEPNRVVLADPVGAIHNLAQRVVRGIRGGGGVLALAPYAAADARLGGREVRLKNWGNWEKSHAGRAMRRKS